MNPLQKMKLSSLQKKVQKFYEQREAGNSGVLEEEIKAHFELAAFYDDKLYDKDVPNAAYLAIECYRAAGILGDAEGQYITGERLVERGKFWDEVMRGPYACEVHQHYAKEAYREGFSYLEAAEEKGHALAVRFHGLAYVHGWGVDKDPTKGFGMVIDSIDLEQAWDRANKIFEDLGLNTPEFYSALGARGRG